MKALITNASVNINAGTRENAIVGDGETIRIQAEVRFDLQARDLFTIASDHDVMALLIACRYYLIRKGLLEP